RYADFAGRELPGVPDVSAVVARSEGYFDSAALDEMRGIADGAGVAFEAIVAHNARFYPDLAAGCCHFAVAAKANGEDGMIHASNEDLPLALSMTGLLARHAQVRYPTGLTPHITFSVAGQLAGLNGTNAHGLGLSSAMLLDLPRRAENS